MAMKQVMTIEQARKLADSLSVGYAKYGSQFSPPVSVATLLEAMIVLNSFGNFDGPNKEEMTKLSRQLTACKAREAQLRGKKQEEQP